MGNMFLRGLVDDCMPVGTQPIVGVCARRYHEQQVQVGADKKQRHWVPNEIGGGNSIGDNASGHGGDTGPNWQGGAIPKYLFLPRSQTVDIGILRRQAEELIPHGGVQEN